MASAFNILYYNHANFDVNFKLYCMGGVNQPGARNLPEYWWNHCPAGEEIGCPVNAATANLGTIFSGIGAIFSLGVAAAGVLVLVGSLGTAAPVVVPAEAGAAAAMTAADAGIAASAAANAAVAGAGVAAAAGEVPAVAAITARLAADLAAGAPVEGTAWASYFPSRAAAVAIGKLVLGIGGTAAIIGRLFSEKLMYGYELGVAAQLPDKQDRPGTQLFYTKQNLVVQNNNWHIPFSGPLGTNWHA